MLRTLQEKKQAGPLRDAMTQIKLIVSYMKNFKPSTWNNIPIPLQELSKHQLSFTRMMETVPKLMQHNTDDLTTVSNLILDFCEASNVSLLSEVQKKITLVNENIDHQIKTLDTTTGHAIERSKNTLDDLMKQCNLDQVSQLRTEMRNLVDSRQQDVLRMIRTEMRNKVAEEVKERLQVPGLIGNNCQYSTLSNYLLTHGGKIEMEVMQVKTQGTAMYSRVDFLEKQNESKAKLIEEHHKAMLSETNRLDRDSERIR